MKLIGVVNWVSLDSIYKSRHFPFINCIVYMNLYALP